MTLKISLCYISTVVVVAAAVHGSSHPPVQLDPQETSRGQTIGCVPGPTHRDCVWRGSNSKHRVICTRVDGVLLWLQEVREIKTEA